MCLAVFFLDHQWGRAAIGQCFYLSPVTVPEVSAKVNSAQFPSCF